jgi:hypothetical protein
MIVFPLKTAIKMPALLCLIKSEIPHFALQNAKFLHLEPNLSSKPYKNSGIVFAII